MSIVWHHFLTRTRIRVRIVAAVVAAMGVVLVCACAFVYWRVSYALSRQLDQDLKAYSDIVTRDLADGSGLPSNNPGLTSQTYDRTGRLTAKSDPGVRTLLPRDRATSASAQPQQFDLEPLLPPPSRNPYRVRYFTTSAAHGDVVVAVAISRAKHDEALRELLAQLAVAALATIAAAGVVGWGAARAALNPVERYRVAAAEAGGDPSQRLPVDPARRDELSRLGTTLNNLLAEIEESHRRERQFLSDASHELRTPLALMSAEVEWAQHRQRTMDEIETVLASIGEQTTRLAELANALLDLEEVTNTASLTTQEVALDEVVERAVQPLRPWATELGREVCSEVGEVTVHADPMWLERAVANLVGNGLKHGEGRVTVRAAEVPDGVAVEVVDEGPGIPAELGERAFDRFARADEARTSRGNGLGLAITAAVARRHGGTVELVPGGVRLTLPEPGARTA